ERGRERVAGRVLALAGIVRVVEVDAPDGEVVVAQHAGGVEARGVGLRGDAVDAGAALPFDLGDGRGAVTVAVLSVALGLVELGSGEGIGPGARRAVRDQRALGPEAALGNLGEQAALAEAEMVFGAAGHRVVALARVERALEDAQRLDQLG